MTEIVPQKRLDPVLRGFKLEGCNGFPELKIKIQKFFGTSFVKET
jgi:hypothetical protein